MLIWDSYLDNSSPFGNGGSVFVVIRIVPTSGVWGRGQGWTRQSHTVRHKEELLASLQTLKCPTRLFSTNIIHVNQYDFNFLRRKSFYNLLCEIPVIQEMVLTDRGDSMEAKFCLEIIDQSLAHLTHHLS